MYTKLRSQNCQFLIFFKHTASIAKSHVTTVYASSATAWIGHGQYAVSLLKIAGLCLRQCSNRSLTVRVLAAQWAAANLSSLAARQPSTASSPQRTSCESHSVQSRRPAWPPLPPRKHTSAGCPAGVTPWTAFIHHSNYTLSTSQNKRTGRQALWWHDMRPPRTHTSAGCPAGVTPWTAFIHHSNYTLSTSQNKRTGRQALWWHDMRPPGTHTSAGYPTSVTLCAHIYIYASSRSRVYYASVTRHNTF